MVAYLAATTAAYLVDWLVAERAAQMVLIWVAEMVDWMAFLSAGR